MNKVLKGPERAHAMLTNPMCGSPPVTAVVQGLSDENMALLKVARDQQPDSMDTLAHDCLQFAVHL